jgi:hypothetical protein
MAFRLNQQVIAYAIRFGLCVSLVKGALSFLRSGAHVIQDIVFHFLLSAVVAIPLFFYKKARERAGIVMDQIVLLCMGMIVAGGMLHDQIAFRVSPEYYHIGHFPISAVKNETLLALIWGFLGTWWFGAGLGIILAITACAGERPHFPREQIFRISIGPLVAIEVLAWLMAAIGYFLTQQEMIDIGGYAVLIPKSKHPAFMADWWANGTAYSLLIVGCVLLGHYIWQQRQTHPDNP